MASEETKAKMKDKILKDDKPLYLSAQEYDRLTDEELEAIDEVLDGEKKDKNDYKRKMKSLWPKKVILPVSWRNNVRPI